MRRRRRLELPVGGFVGIDPGRSGGGIAYVVDDLAFAWPIEPLTDRELWERISGLAKIAKAAALEHVWAVGGKGKKIGAGSSFKFGASFGELKMALIASELVFELVVPTKWQTALSCRTKGDKKISKAAAERRWPGLTITNATADALLLAEYARRTLG